MACLFPESKATMSSYSLARKETTLVNRVREIALLNGALENAVNHVGGSFVLTGESGIGKTRLVKELRAHARLLGMRVLNGRCTTLFPTNSTPYTVWKEVIKDYLQNCTPEQLQRAVGYYPGEICKIVPEIRQKLIMYADSPALDPEKERERLFEALSQFVANISKESPLLITLDDLQWADQSSLSLLHYIARGIRNERLLFLCSFRDTEVEENHPLSFVIADLNRERLLQTLQLKRFSVGETEEMIKRILGQDDLRTRFCQCIYDKTNGNPFFIEETIESLREAGFINQEHGELKITEVSEIEFPRNVRDVLRARMDRLGEQGQELLSMASLIGNEFTFDALREVTGTEEDSLLETMEKILKTGLLKCRVRRGKDVCTFSDVLIRDVLYQEINPLRRKKLHSLVGTALEKAYAKEGEEHSGELATHFLEAGEKDKALKYFLKAGERAERIYAHNEAAIYFESALTLLAETNNVDEKTRLLERLADSLDFVGKYENCIRLWKDSAQLLRETEQKETAARLNRKIAKVLWSKLGDTEKAEKYLNAALELLETEPETFELASIRSDLSRMYFRFGDYSKAILLGKKALATAKRLNAHRVISDSCITLGAVACSRGNRKRAVEYFEEALDTALVNWLPENAVYAYDNLGWALTGSNEKERRFESYRKGFELAKKVGAISAQSWIGIHLSDIYFGMGNMKDALLLREESAAIDRKTGNLVNLAVSLSSLGHLYDVLGEWTAAERTLNEAIELTRRIKDAPAIGYAYLALGYFYVNKGEYGKAVELRSIAYDFADKTGAKTIAVVASEFVIWALIELGKTEQAKEQIDELCNTAKELEDEERVAYADGLRAMLLRTQKRWDESIKHFERSLSTLVALEAEKWNLYDFAKRFLFEYSKVYLERNQEGDSQKALAILSQALEIFEKIGAKKDVERVKAVISKVEEKRFALESKNHARTGLTILDRLLQGGIPRNYAVALTSPPCDGKASLVRQFIETGAKNNELTLFMTSNPVLAKTLAQKHLSNLYLFVCNTQAETIIKSSSNVFTLKGVENLTEINIVLTQALRRLTATINNGKRICIDILSDVLLQHRTVQTRKWLNELLTELRAYDFTILATIDMQMHPPEETHAILGLFDGEISLRQSETDSGPQTLLKVRRMTDQQYAKNETPLRDEDT